MKTLSIISLATAFALSATGMTYAQASVLGTVDVDVGGTSGADAGVSVNLGGSQSGTNASVVIDVNGDGNISAAEQEAAAAIRVNVGNNGLAVKVDANANGSISDDELAAANVALAVHLGPGATVDLNADGTISNAEEAAADAALAVDVNVGNGTTTASIDINGNGSISAEELAAATIALEIALGTSVTIDLNGDGVISPDEIVAADNALANAGGGMNIAVIACGKSGLEAMIASFGSPDMGVLAVARKVTVVGVANCQAGEVSATLKGQGAADIRTVLAANAVAIRAIQARNADLSDVLGATTTTDAVTVYIEAATTAG